MPAIRPDIKAGIDQFMTHMQAASDRYFAAHYPTSVSTRFDIEEGGVKYLRILATNRYERDGVISDGQRSAYCFIDLNNGDILKADGYKKPAKGARSNIFKENGGVPAHADPHTGWLYKGR